MNKKAIVIDGNSLLYRAFYASYNQLEFYKENNLKALNALKLMLQIFFKFLYLEKYDYAVISYDHKDKTFRDDIFDDYKKNRKKTPEELIEQIPHEVQSLGVSQGPVATADDVMAASPEVQAAKKRKLILRNRQKSPVPAV